MSEVKLTLWLAGSDLITSGGVVSLGPPVGETGLAQAEKNSAQAIESLYIGFKYEVRLPIIWFTLQRWEFLG